jgi:Tfp pilus assembly protein PilX
MSTKRIKDINQSGAALVTVILISFMLLTACVAVLTAVGANSRNTSDVLSETKAYYAAESGIQATIDVLRNRVEGDDSGVSYAEAISGSRDLAAWLTYNYTASTPARVTIGPGTYDPNTGTAYSIKVSDPDNTAASTTFTTTGIIQNGSTWGAFRDFTSGGSTTRISYSGITSATTITHPDASELLGSFSVTNLAGTSVTIPSTRFQINYSMSLPRPATISIGGILCYDNDANNSNGCSNSGSLRARFDSVTYTILGGSIALTGLTTTDRILTTPTVLNVASLTQINSVIGPVEPYRLKVLSTGYGPNGARKQLEAIVQRNLFNGLMPPGPNNLIGGSCPVGETCFSLGTSNGITYNGCSELGCGPSIVVTNQSNLDYINANPPGGSAGQMTPPPIMVDPNALPPWMSNPQSLDLLVDQIRVAAQNSGRYFVSPNGNLNNPGNFTEGTGITFCEGSCQVGGRGGGVLVVTGQLTNLGGFDFKGIIIVTGEEGWLRNGGGNGQVIGNVIIAPYNRMSYVPENLSSTYLPPRYVITGGGGSDIIAGDTAPGFDSTSGISDFIAGVAEK